MERVLAGPGLQAAVGERLEAHARHVVAGSLLGVAHPELDVVEVQEATAYWLWAGQGDKLGQFVVFLVRSIFRKLIEILEWRVVFRAYLLPFVRVGSLEVKENTHVA